jgi:hypothetical protein
VVGLVGENMVCKQSPFLLYKYKLIFYMNRIEIEGKLDKDWVNSLLAEGYSTYDIINNYELTEDTILECNYLLNKNILIQGLSFTEDFINKAIEIEYFNLEDIYDLNMTTYSNLSSDFILNHKEYINWNRMILYLSTQSDSFEEHIDIINDKNLWQIISANDLPLDFIRQWKDKLDWSLLSMVKNFTDDEKEEFLDYILTPVQSEIKDESFIDSSNFKFIEKMTNEELEDLINEISKHIGR